MSRNFLKISLLSFDSVIYLFYYMMINNQNEFGNEHVIEFNFSSSWIDSKVTYLEVYIDDKERIYRHTHIKCICDFEILFI